MTCYKPTQGCGVYENSSCSECPYSKPPKVETVSIINSLDVIGKVCHICGEPFAMDNFCDPNQFCPECLNRLNRILYPERNKAMKITKHKITEWYHVALHCDECDSIMNPNGFDTKAMEYKSICSNCENEVLTGRI